MSEAAFHIGADENGLGPRLGPMIVTAVLARVASGSEALLRQAPDGEMATRLGDSKGLVGFGDDALAEAWTRALVARRAGRHDRATCPDDLIDAVSLDPRAELQRPCAPHVLPQCWNTEGEAFEPKSEKLLPRVLRDLDSLAARGITVMAVRSVVVCNWRLDEAARAGRSRFLVDLHAMERLILALREHAGDDVDAVCGKVGGYGQYGKVFGPLGGRLHTVVEESRARSAYRFPGIGDVAFAVDADASHLLVSLASLVGKYLRERLMGRIVNHYRRRDSALPIVSGYHDPVTTRFVEATATQRREQRIPDACFERAKRST